MPFVDTRDRTRLYYLDGGAGAPVVFIAGAWLSSRMWERQLAAATAQGLRVVAYDRRGHGRSDWPWNGYDYDTLADDLAALLDHLELRGATLVAHSMGGGEAIRYVTRHGAGRIAGLILVSATAPFPMKTADNPVAIERYLMEADMAVRIADRPRWYAGNADAFFGAGLPGVRISPACAEFMIQQCLDCLPRAADEFFLTGFTTDLRAEMRALTVPTLIIHGDHDRQAPFEICGHKSARLVPGSRLIVYENAAHGLFVTHAQRLSADICAFAKSVSAPRRPAPALAFESR